MSDRRGSGIVTVLLALIMVATAALAGFLVMTSGILAGESDLGRPLQEGSPAAGSEAIETDESVKITGSFQLSQPRDPFKPLITPDSPVVGIPGVGGLPGSGSEDGTFVPGSTSITLVEIRDVDGVLRATIVVNGVTYEVGEGDTFAGSYQVVKITEESVVIMFGDTAFELKVGQQILK
jgi:hypothetical protein